MFCISLQKLYLFSRKSKFIILDIQISWRYKMPKHKISNTFNTYSLLMKFEQFMSYYRRKLFLKRHTKTGTWKLVPDPLVPGPLLENKFLKQATYIRYVTAKLQNCSNQHAALLRFLFTEDSLILRKIFILYYINWPNFITRLCLLLKLFSRMCFVFPKFVRGCQPRTPSQIFKGTHPLTQLASSLFEIFVSTPLFSIPPPF